MNKQQNVIEFYLLCNRLKNIIRTGWKAWNVKRERLESIAEHIYGTQMLALAMWSEFKYDLDIKKVMFISFDAIAVSGITVEAPIEIEDFYYLYDSENEYYYYRPSTPSYYQIDQINSLKETKNGYEINCSIVKNIDTEVLKVEDVSIELTSKPENSIIKYMVNEISF